MKANKSNGTRVLSYEEHEIALLISCKKDFKEGDATKKELEEYLMKIKPLAEKKGFSGFAFLNEFEDGE